MDWINTQFGIPARLPQRLEETNTIDRMKIGQGGWVVPWGMWADHGRRCWLRPKYTFDAEEFGTARMRVDRTEDGYVVDVSRCRDQRWEPRGIADAQDIPVAAILGLE